ncbi:copper-binding protein [Trabulsiella odontotermitis]|uniref:copper-binding protein n=1 Tax=Trabulsiella odontotermitis TaxID=379893 RepID=UPI0006768FB3|nr:copper-binding protein [Trabulsiella odontotermitis]KNC89940.1 hypothetical protein GM30_06255 [Trabulsiella odontotermitis]
MSRIFSALTGVLFAFTVFAAHSTSMSHDHMNMTGDAASAQPTYHTEGVVKQITPTSLTLSHHAIAELNWPPMTMQFALASDVTLPALKVGDKVAFSFIQGDAGYQIVSLNALN